MAAANRLRRRPSSAATPEARNRLLFTAKRQYREDTWLERFAERAQLSPQSDGRPLSIADVFTPPKQVRLSATRRGADCGGLGLNPFVGPKQGPTVATLPFAPTGRTIRFRNSICPPPSRGSSAGEGTEAPGSPVAPLSPGMTAAPASPASLPSMRSFSPPHTPQVSSPTSPHSPAVPQSVPVLVHSKSRRLPVSMSQLLGPRSKKLARLLPGLRRVQDVATQVDGTLHRLRQRPASPPLLSSRLDREVEHGSERACADAAKPSSPKPGPRRWFPGSGNGARDLAGAHPNLSSAVLEHFNQERQEVRRRSLKRVSLLVSGVMSPSSPPAGGADPAPTTPRLSARRGSAGSDGSRGSSVQGASAAVRSDPRDRGGPPAARWLLRHGASRVRSAARARGAQMSLERYTALKRDFDHLDTRKRGRLSMGQLCTPGAYIAGRPIDVATFHRLDRDSAGFVTFPQVLGYFHPTAPPAELQARRKEWEARERWRQRADLSEGRWVELYPPDVLNEACELFDMLDVRRARRLEAADLSRIFHSGERGAGAAFSDAEVSCLVQQHCVPGTSEVSLGGFVEMIKHAYPELVDPSTSSAALLAPSGLLDDPARHAPSMTRQVRLHGNPFTAIKAQQLSSRERQRQRQRGRRPRRGL
eukprot:TRINITY_DN32101_c0_g1_i1.p1 TRINITY_DN32101_c0_g1~~TRINITY_DN32101_c0_g1_i1.p1  ORF type:complete len:660 (+),score=177.67 TRINITY_DN32101_c0_g1_i1:45-1982(+)